MRFIFCLDNYFVGIYTVLNIVSRNVKSPFYIALLTIQIDSKQFYSDKKWMQHFFVLAVHEESHCHVLSKLSIDYFPLLIPLKV